jgi:dynein heavy chain 1
MDEWHECFSNQGNVLSLSYNLSFLCSQYLLLFCNFFQVHKNYTQKDFDKDLRAVLIRAGAKQEKICFIFDESNVLDSAFLERMNALLASGEVPGLFENADFKQLMIECKEAYKRDASGETTEDDLYKRFCQVLRL